LGKAVSVSGAENIRFDIKEEKMEEKTKRGMTSGILDRSEEVRWDETRSQSRGGAVCGCCV
jgi:hypothetical protein